jgi:solute carrier family 25 carnitine/acylcarnitine transporter 20/29
MGKDDKKKPLLTLRDFLSGGAAGMSQVIVGQPFDIVKVRLQTSTVALSPITVLKELVSKEGPLALYKGTLSPLIGCSFAVANQFCGFELAKRLFQARKGEHLKLSNTELILSGGVGGFFYGLVLCPMELFRIKMQVKDSRKVYKSSIDAAIQIYKEYGIKGIYSGLSATFVREIFGSMIYFGVYEICMQKALPKYDNDRKKIPIYQVLSFGGLAGFSLWLSIYPADIIKSKMQGSDFETSKYKTFLGTGKLIIQEHGIGGLFKGLVPCLIRAPVVNAISFLVYEVAQENLAKRNI